MSIQYPIEQIRNIGIIAHIDAGKTTITERILFYSGRTHRMGTVDSGDTVTDWMDQERERGITIVAAAITTTWQDSLTGQVVQINIIDTPGHIDFTAEVQRSLRVLDGAVVVFDAVNGVEPQSETVWRQANDFHVPRICFINKMDRMGADFAAAVATIAHRLKANPLPLQMPIGQEGAFVGVVDLLEMQALLFTDELGDHPEIGPVPADLRAAAEAARAQLVERIAETDDDLTLQYLEGEEITLPELYAALRRAVLRNQVTPVLAGSALRNKGVQPLLDAILRYLPSPQDVPPVQGVDPKTGQALSRQPRVDEPLAALVFKIVADPYADRLAYVRVYSGVLKAGSTVYNVNRERRERVARLVQMQADKREDLTVCNPGEIVAVVGLKQTFTGETLSEQGAEILLEQIRFPLPVIQMAIEPRSSADEEKLSAALVKLDEEDPTFQVKVDPQSGQTLIGGMGELHLEIAVERLLREFRVLCNVGSPRVAHRETVTRVGQAEGVYSRQIGNENHFAAVSLAVSPADSGAGLIFDNQCSPEILPRDYVPVIRRTVEDALPAGALAGFPLVDIRVTVTGASYRVTDSHPDDFAIAAGVAFREACQAAGPVLLEPIMDLDVRSPEESVGGVMTDMARRRGRVGELSVTPDGVQIIRAMTPLAELLGYATDLRSLTSGRGAFSMELDHFAPASRETYERMYLDPPPSAR